MALKIVADTDDYLLPLYAKTKTGAIQTWRVWTEGADILTEYGQKGGRLQQSRKSAVSTNEGRSNQRDASEQAVAQARALWRARLERKYSRTPEAAQAPLTLPMLAEKLKPKALKSFPVSVQPKLDGCRCLAYWDEGVLRMTSRGGKEWNLPHIREQLEQILPEGTIFDGELYCHGFPFQTLTSWMKRQQPESAQILYHVYDIPATEGDGDLLWQERLVELLDWKTQSESGDYDVKFVETYEARSLDEIKKFEEQFVQAGYEGGMVRLPDYPYEWGYRSAGLLKVKSFDDMECVVLSCGDGKGKMAGAAVWHCSTPDGVEFDCVTASSMATRKQQYQDRAQFIGRKLTVRHFGFFTDGAPRFPVGSGFRPDEDMPVS